jgi:hypothetical protein
MSDKEIRLTDAAEEDDLRAPVAASPGTPSKSPTESVAHSNAPPHPSLNDDGIDLVPPGNNTDAVDHDSKRAGGASSVLPEADLTRAKKKIKKPEPIDYDFSSEDTVHSTYKLLMGGREPTAMSPHDMVKDILLTFNVNSLKEFSKQKLGCDYPKYMNKQNAVHEIAQRIVKAMSQGSEAKSTPSKENNAFPALG